jgi:hypothetical protein
MEHALYCNYNGLTEWVGGREMGKSREAKACLRQNAAKSERLSSMTLGAYACDIPDRTNSGSSQIRQFSQVGASSAQPLIALRIVDIAATGSSTA